MGTAFGVLLSSGPILPLILTLQSHFVPHKKRIGIDKFLALGRTLRIIVDTYYRNNMRIELGFN